MESFEDVLKILGHVLKMRKVKAMYTLSGNEVQLITPSIYIIYQFELSITLYYLHNRCNLRSYNLVLHL